MPPQYTAAEWEALSQQANKGNSIEFRDQAIRSFGAVFDDLVNSAGKAESR